MQPAESSAGGVSSGFPSQELHDRFTAGEISSCTRVATATLTTTVVVATTHAAAMKIIGADAVTRESGARLVKEAGSGARQLHGSRLHAVGSV